MALKNSDVVRKGTQETSTFDDPPLKNSMALSIKTTKDSRNCSIVTQEFTTIYYINNTPLIFLLLTALPSHHQHIIGNSKILALAGHLYSIGKAVVLIRFPEEPPR